MTTFDLRGAQVGARILKAIRRAAEEGEVVLDCAGATFVAAVNLDNVTFAKANFTGATFERGLRLREVRFAVDASLDRVHTSDLFLDDVTFAGDAGFRELEAANLSIRDSSFERYASFDGSRLGFGGFRDVRFAAEARFRSLSSVGPVTMRSVRFAGATSFHQHKLRTLKELSFPGCEFHGPLQARGLAVEDGLSFAGAWFKNTRVLSIGAGVKVSMEDASFAQPVAIAVKSPAFDATGACFEQGADISLAPGSRGTFSMAAFGGPSLIATNDSQDGPPARIEAMDGTRVDRLSLQGLDLRECSFARLHRLDDVLISSRGQLALASGGSMSSYRREILADEVALRSIETDEGPRGTASAIADVYRSMRKAREESRDYPGAADFYYGEMEMRRASADSWVERTVLTLYWLLSGYGMRAGRAALAFAAVVLLLSIGFQTLGFDKAPCFWHTVAWTLTASISLTRPVEAVDLTTAGLYMNVAIRLLGPALLALAVLALRSRVRR